MRTRSSISPRRSVVALLAVAALTAAASADGREGRSLTASGREGVSAEPPFSFFEKMSLVQGDIQGAIDDEKQALADFVDARTVKLQLEASATSLRRVEEDLHALEFRPDVKPAARRVRRALNDDEDARRERKDGHLDRARALILKAIREKEAALEAVQTLQHDEERSCRPPRVARKGDGVEITAGPCSGQVSDLVVRADGPALGTHFLRIRSPGEGPDLSCPELKSPTLTFDCPIKPPLAAGRTLTLDVAGLSGGTKLELLLISPTGIDSQVFALPKSAPKKPTTPGGSLSCRARYTLEKDARASGGTGALVKWSCTREVNAFRAIFDREIDAVFLPPVQFSERFGGECKTTGGQLECAFKRGSFTIKPGSADVTFFISTRPPAAAGMKGGLFVRVAGEKDFRGAFAITG